MVAGGSGARFGSPKQFELLGDRRLVDWAIEAAHAVADGVVLVVPFDRAGDAAGTDTVDAVVAGGGTRSESVRAGLNAVPIDAGVIVVHDAARPLAPPELFQAVVAAVEHGADGAIPAVPVTDTVKRVHNGVVVETLERDGLVTVQTPQAFRAEALRQAHHGGGDATDDAALVESLGGRVAVVPGDPGNVKVTGPSDLEAAKLTLAGRHLL